MKYRHLGKTGATVSEIGMGTWSMGNMWGPRDDASAIQAILTFIENGGTFIDTAWAYGNGVSESLIAKAFAQYGEKNSRQVMVASKIPPQNHAWPARDEVPASEVFPAEWIIKKTEESLQNLKMETLDLQQLHVWAPRFLREGDWLSAIERLKRDGKIRFFGVSVNDHAPESVLELVASGLVDTLQVIYNVFDQSPEDQLFPLCFEKNVGIIARVPFDEGSLTGTLTPETVFQKSDWRRFYFTQDRLKETCERVERLRGDFKESEISLPQRALQFCLSHPAVSTVIPGMRRPKHVLDNLRVSDFPILSSAELEQFRRHRWVRNFYPVHGK